jgi:hypothetical protein
VRGSTREGEGAQAGCLSDACFFRARVRSSGAVVPSSGAYPVMNARTGACLEVLSRICIAVPSPACFRNGRGDGAPRVFFTALTSTSLHSLISVI